ncbi:MAG: hypothetical protein NTW30_06140 [Candidatus Aenigmarchaeota archaeon]|nr:hypothetical protein [Candidatus Aenigmarchaeota archaeon]
MKFIFFTADGIGLPIAYRLLKEGNDVIIAQVQNVEDLGNGDKNEHPDIKRTRLENYNGILTKYDAKEVLRNMKKISNKDEVFVFFDFNNLWRFAEVALKMGFTKGFFPSKEDYELEKDRNKAKDLVKKYYPGLKVADVHEFKTTDEAKQMLEESEDIWVLKGNSECAKTFVPSSKNAELAKIQIIEMLDENTQDYESSGFILEKMINNPRELTPESIWWDGKLVATNIDIENKPLGSGNIADQTGCSANLIIKTEIDDEINKISFPPFVEEMAKKHKGMFVWDASLLCDEDKYFFGEFCSCRVGWDSVFSEILMSGSATNYFKSISEGKNPFIYKFGVSVRGFNIAKKDEGIDYKVIKSSMNWMQSADKNVFPYEMMMEDGKVTNIGASPDMVVFAGSGNEIEDALDEVYETIENFSFEDMYTRPRFDFTSYDYPSSIMNRFMYGLDRSLYSSEKTEEINELESLEETK